MTVNLWDLRNAEEREYYPKPDGSVQDPYPRKANRHNDYLLNLTHYVCFTANQGRLCCLDIYICEYAGEYTEDCL